MKNQAHFEICNLWVRQLPALQDLQKSGQRWNLQNMHYVSSFETICGNFRAETHVLKIVSFEWGSPEKFVQKIWDKSKKYLLRDSHSFVVTCRILQNTLIMRVWLAICSVSWTIKQVFGFVIFESDHHLLCRMSRKVSAKNLGQTKKKSAPGHELIVVKCRDLQIDTLSPGLWHFWHLYIWKTHCYGTRG